MSTDRVLDDKSMDILFRKARTYNGWLDKDVSDDQVHAIYDLFKFGPTSANCSPMRVLFLKTDEAKQRLKPHLMEGNVDKTMSAPVVAIMANDMEFYEKLPKLFPHTDARSWFVGNDDMIQSTADRNGTLQGAYLMLAARSLGLDCGPMSGFDQDGVKKEFFPDKNYQVNFITNIGYGDESTIFDRSPRFDFDEACEIL